LSLACADTNEYTRSLVRHIHKHVSLHQMVRLLTFVETELSQVQPHATMTCQRLLNSAAARTCSLQSCSLLRELQADALIRLCSLFALPCSPAQDAILCLERVHEALVEREARSRGNEARHVSKDARRQGDLHDRPAVESDVLRLRRGHYDARQRDGVLAAEDVTWIMRQLELLRHTFHYKIHVLLLTCVMLATKVSGNPHAITRGVQLGSDA
jgi:hypothetical protein